MSAPESINQQIGSIDEMAEAVAVVFAHRRLLTGTKRSVEFGNGFAAQLSWWAKGAQKGIGAGVPPYPIGTASADAWWAGWDAGSNPQIRDECFAAIILARRIAVDAISIAKATGGEP